MASAVLEMHKQKAVNHAFESPLKTKLNPCARRTATALTFWCQRFLDRTAREISDTEAILSNHLGNSETHFRQPTAWRSLCCVVRAKKNPTKQRRCVRGRKRSISPLRTNYWVNKNMILFFFFFAHSVKQNYFFCSLISE